MDELEDEQQIELYKLKLKDRFGDIPTPTNELFNALILRKLAKKIGFEKLVLKQQKLIGYFIANQDSAFYQSNTFTNVLRYVQANQKLCSMKERNDKLTLVFENVRTIKQANQLLEPIIQPIAVE
jgi:transcription-repair coupling factor (superfamily II helicase)